jgi:hypothetical protein
LDAAGRGEFRKSPLLAPFGGYASTVTESAGILFLSLVIGSIGLALFIYGKRQSRLPQLVGGLLLMAYPYFIGNLWLLGGIAAGILFLVWGAVKMGY